MLKIRIIDTPEGDHPLEIRKAWVGCVLDATGPTEIDSEGTLSWKLTQSPTRFVALKGYALQVLGECNEEAAAWHNRNLPAHATLVAFNRKACEIISE